ncbi:catabolite control protein A [Spirochaetia bacterium]|nr:catabolite control protein A [Spirochaetia bacterium]
MPVTILDIAREAGVSKSTVSLVINNAENVKMETRYKVQQAIERLGYIPNQAARQLILNRTHTLGLVFLTSNHFNKEYAFSSVPETLFYSASTGINRELANTDYTLLTERFSSIMGSNVLPNLIKARRLDGVFLIGGLFKEELIEHIQKLRLPVIIIGRQYKNIDSVQVDLEQTGYMAVRHLLERGHKNILFVNGPETSSNSALKAQGVTRALEEKKANHPALHIIHSGYSGLNGYEAIKKHWKEKAPPSAIFCGSDGIAAGVMRFLYEKGLHVPRDISILTSEISMLTEFCSPALTSIDPQYETLGKEACRILLNRIKKPKAQPTTLLLPPIMIQWNSVRDLTGGEP